MPAALCADEPAEWNTIVCDGLQRIEMYDGYARYVMYMLERCPRTGTERRVIIPDRIQAPFAAMAPAARMMMFHVAERWGRNAAGVLVPG